MVESKYKCMTVHFPTIISRAVLGFREIKARHFMIGTLVLFVVLALIVHRLGILSVDIQMSVFLQSFRSPALDAFFTSVTFLGEAGPLIVVALLAAGILWRMQRRIAALIAVVSLVAYPVNVGIKNYVERARPHSALIKVIVPVGGFSFPSGHAMISIVVYGAASYLIWLHLKDARRRYLVIIPTLLILLIGISRIYLGVHWFSDVIGGWLAGSVILFLLVEIYHWFLLRFPTEVSG